MRRPTDDGSGPRGFFAKDANPPFLLCVAGLMNICNAGGSAVLFGRSLYTSALLMALLLSLALLAPPADCWHGKYPLFSRRGVKTINRFPTLNNRAPHVKCGAIQRRSCFSSRRSNTKGDEPMSNTPAEADIHYTTRDGNERRLKTGWIRLP